jgi:MoaA/NifB/PqqE/SkfB family radical SAM enzyme
MIFMKFFDQFKFLFANGFSNVILYPTARCNAQCSHCFFYKEINSASKRNELTLEEIIKISNSLGEFNYLSISGGEPFLRNDLSKIFKIFYSKNKIQNLSIHTNGSRPEYIEKVCRETLESCPNLTLSMYISLDEIGKRHDKIRKYKGLFARVVKTTKLLKELQNEYPNLVLNAISIFCNSNKREMFEIHNYVENNLEIPHGVVFIRGKIKNPNLKKDIIKEYENYITEVKYRKEIQKKPTIFLKLKFFIESFVPSIIIETAKNDKMIFPCQAGKKTLVIYDNGDVAPCETLGKKFGNVRDVNYSIKSLIDSEEGKKISKFIRDERCHCTWECIIPVNIVQKIIKVPYVVVIAIFNRLVSKI